MSSLIAKLWTCLCPKRAPLSIMIVGLDNSGKTSILNTLASLNHHGSANSTPSYQSQAQQPPTATPTTLMTTKQPTSTSTTKELGESSTTTATTSLTSTASTGLLLTDDSRSDSGLSISGGNRTSSSSGAFGSGSGNSGNIMPTVGYNYERVQYRSLTITVLDFSGQNRYRNLWQEFYNGVDGIVFVIDSSDLIRFVVVRDELETMLSHPYFSSLSAASGGDMRAASSGNNNLANMASLQLLAPNSAAATVQKQLTISQGKLIQTTLADSSGQQPSMLSSASSAVANKFASGIVLGHHVTSNSNNQQKTTNGKKGAGISSGGHQSRRRSKVPILFLANKTDLPNSVDTEVISKALNLNQLPSDRHPWFIQATSISLNQGIVEGFDWLVSQLTATSN